MPQWVAIAFGFGGLAVAALTLLLSYRERVAGLRVALYAKQLECYDRVLGALTELQEAVIAETAGKRLPLDDQARAELREKAQPQYAKFAQAFVATVPFLPDAVAAAAAEYRATFAAITAPPTAVHIYPRGLAQARDPQGEFARAFLRIWEAMRQQLGTDPISTQTLKLFGAPEAPD